MDDLDKIQLLCKEFKEMLPADNGPAHVMLNKILEEIENLKLEKIASKGLLTKREFEIIEIAVKGFTNREIASALSISEKTVEFHLKNIYQKLVVSGRAEAIAIVISKGILG